MKQKLFDRLKRQYVGKVLRSEIVKDKTKIFCIGRNKTGTTSLKKAFQDLGFTVGSQKAAEKLLPFYKDGNFEPVIRYCESAQVFQDFPFSYPETFKYMDRAFPTSKFILSVRDSSEQWYNSLTKFHAKMFGKGNIPTKEDLENASYVWKGWMWECNRIMYKTPDEDPYNKEIVMKSYEEYNESVKKYFRDRPQDFLTINLSDKDSYQKMIKFLKIDSPFTDFPWENKTIKIAVK